MTDQTAAPSDRGATAQDEITALKRSEIAGIFAEWQRRVRTDPEAWATAEEVDEESIEDNGARCAAVFLGLHAEIHGG